jgi:hypothetical protein
LKLLQGAITLGLGEFKRMSAQNQSPVTGIIEENQVVIDFGKYEGKTVQEIAELDRAFYDRLVQEKENGVFAIRRHRDKTFRLYVNPLSNMDQ